jgi:hypothetical protein
MNTTQSYRTTSMGYHYRTTGRVRAFMWGALFGAVLMVVIL